MTQPLSNTMENRNPVLLVHGFLDTQSVFQPMTRFLECKGWSVHTLNLIPNDGRKSLPELAQQVQVYVDEHLGADAKFDLVGFSMGGLVTRYYLQRLGGNERVERYVSISAPNNGTLTAYGVPLPGIRQMRPHSDFLTDLNRDVAIALEKVRVTWMWTPYDVMILPAHSTRLPIGREVKLAIALHPWMLRDQRVFHALEQTLLDL